MTKNFMSRIEILRRALGRDRPAALSVVFKDGHEAVVDAGIAVELARTGVVREAKSVRGRNGMLPDLLTGLLEDDEKEDEDDGEDDET